MLIAETLKIDRRAVMHHAYWLASRLGGSRPTFRRCLARAWAEARNQRTRALFDIRRTAAAVTVPVFSELEAAR